MNDIKVGDWVMLPPIKRRRKWWQIWKQREWFEPRKTYRATEVVTSRVDAHNP